MARSMHSSSSAGKFIVDLVMKPNFSNDIKLCSIFSLAKFHYIELIADSESADGYASYVNRRTCFVVHSKCIMTKMVGNLFQNDAERIDDGRLLVMMIHL